MNYEEALNYIHAVQWAGHKPGLTRTRTLLAALGNPHKQLRFIHVAGTNGKGSTAAMQPVQRADSGKRPTDPGRGAGAAGGACEARCRCHDRYPH